MEPQRPLAFLLYVAVLLLAAECVYGDYGGWDSAHATFYGGGDASGTMGELKI